MATLLCSITINATYIYMRVVPMIPHSYLVHFELVQTHCLSSVLCTFLTLTIHVHDINHCSSWLIQKLIIPLKQKGKQVKWVIILMDSCSKKKRGEDDKSKNIDDGQVPMFTLAHGQSSLMA